MVNFDSSTDNGNFFFFNYSLAIIDVINKMRSYP